MDAVKKIACERMRALIEPDDPTQAARAGAMRLIAGQFCRTHRMIARARAQARQAFSNNLPGATPQMLRKTQAVAPR